MNISIRCAGHNPQGKANLRRPEHFYAIQPYTPSVTFGDTSPLHAGRQRFTGSSSRRRRKNFYKDFLYPLDKRGLYV